MQHQLIEMRLQQLLIGRLIFSLYFSSDKWCFFILLF